MLYQYYDALVINWNDMLLNVEATRGGFPPGLALNPSYPSPKASIKYRPEALSPKLS